MIGISQICGFIGVALGFIAGMRWSREHSWLVCVAASLAGAVAGGVVGWISGFVFLQEIPDRLRRFSQRHPAVGGFFFWSYLGACFLLLIGGWFLGIRYLRLAR